MKLAAGHTGCFDNALLEVGERSGLTTAGVSEAANERCPCSRGSRGSIDVAVRVAPRDEA